MGDAGEGWASHAEIWYRGVRVPADEPARARGRRLPDRAGAARARAASITACAGSASASACSTRCAGASRAARSTTTRRSATRQIAQAWIAEARAEIDARAADGAARGVDDREQGLRGGARSGVADQVLRRRRDAAARRPRDPAARRARHHRATPCSRTTTSTSAARASTTAPTRSTRWSSRSGSSQRYRVTVEIDAPKRRPRRRGARRRARSTAYLERELGAHGAGHGRAVPRRPLEPDVPRPPRRSRVRAAPAAVRQQGEDARTTWAARSRVLSKLAPVYDARAAGRSRTATTPRCSARRSI